MDRIGVRVEREGRALTVRYRISGKLDRILVPPARPARFADGLWRRTCCELFVKVAGSDAYREFNFSPSGEWAAYRFESYRTRAAQQAKEVDPAISVQQKPGSLQLAAIAHLESANEKLLLGLACVIEEAVGRVSPGRLSYWALKHAPGKPDFHHADAFALELDEVRH